ncbi:MAG: M20/M25/M40 family metallo-hydrolase [Candidatus Dojkabacteria bacterium]|nr:MAG: M20/M25/M40 family metallo-hydrolase [Candidatus Dojkabacteria bacterium]
MDNYRQLLAQFVQLRSISTDPQYHKEIVKTTEWLKKLFQENNFEVEIIEGYENPVVFAQYITDKGYESVLVYGHYDVQPATVEDGWDSDPFELTERDGKLFARGVVDNKGQILAHISSVIDLIESGELKYNVKFLIEGNEETGGSGVGQLLKDQQEKLSADHIVISDGELPYKPVITASFRGTFNLTVKYKTAAMNLHSGLYGGNVPNAAQELAKLIASLYDEQYKSTIQHLYDGQDEMSDSDLGNCKVMDKEKEASIKHAGVKKIFGGEHDSFSANLGFTTMYTVSGFKSGYTGEGYSNIVPSQAEARINFRVAASQNPQDVYYRFEKFVKENTPEYVDWEIVNLTEFTKPVRVDLTSPKHVEVNELLSEVYGEEVLVDYCGATIPVVVDFKEELGVDPLLISLGNDDCNMHGPNENFDLGLVEKALHFSKRFFSKN